MKPPAGEPSSRLSETTRQAGPAGRDARAHSPEADRGFLLTRTQSVMLLILVCLLAGALFVFKHRQRLNASDITLIHGDGAGYEFTIDINSASWQEIALLPGIGPAKAQAIVEYRDEHGPFGSSDALTAVPGIGAKTADAISAYVTVGQDSR